MNFGNFGLSGVWMIFLLFVGLAILIVVGYFLYYRVSINKSLHSDKPQKRVSPQKMIIIVLSVLLAISVGFSMTMVLQKAPSDKQQDYFKVAYEDVRGGVFDPLFENEEIAQRNGYWLSTWNENGFEICTLTRARQAGSLIPSVVLRVRYTEELPPLQEWGQTIDYDFGLWCRNANEAEFAGMSARGDYRQNYLAVDALGSFQIQIKADLRLMQDKENLTAPFASIQFGMMIHQNG